MLHEYIFLFVFHSFCNSLSGYADKLFMKMISI